MNGVAARKVTSEKDRLGQSEFRQAVLRSYGQRCCVTAVSVVELLEAAHIQPYIDARSNHVQNGLAMRVDIHRLFDEGLVSISEDGTLMVSSRLSGTSYASLAGRKVRQPLASSQAPSRLALDYHRTNLFR